MTTLAESRQKETKPIGKLASVLCVDDDVNFLDSLRRTFRPYNIEFDAAFDGLQAYAALTKNKPDLIISDHTMPAATGDELLHWLRGNKLVCEIPLIIVSGAVNEQQQSDFIANGADAVLQKPITSVELLTEVQRLLGPLETNR